MLGQQFMHNAGEPYKFIVKTSTQPFSDAAPVIKEVLELLRERVGMVVPGCEFNEILSVAYMEGQRMEVPPSPPYRVLLYHKVVFLIYGLHGYGVLKLWVDG
jgi:hypothetical protein